MHDVVKLENIWKIYHLGEVDLQVLRGVSLTVAGGELVSLMGASGSGKSTLMNIIGCLDHPTSGKYWLDGEEVSRFDARERARLRNRFIGFVFQSFNLLPRTSALENVLIPLSYSREGLSEGRKRQRAVEMLDKVGLADRIGHQSSQLSGGEQQRVAIARALINRPRLLLADEPTGNLDSHTSEDILRMIENLNRDEGITVILVTHDPAVARHTPRTISIKDGLIESTASGACAASGESGASGALAGGGASPASGAVAGGGASPASGALAGGGA